MFFLKLVLATVLLVAVNARSINNAGRTFKVSPYDPYDYYWTPEDDLSERIHETRHPILLANSRVRRQAQTSVRFNSDGSRSLAGKLPLFGNDKNIVSAIGTADYNNNMNTGRGFGLALDNVNGHGLSVMRETVPGFGNKLTGAGKLNVFHNSNHDVNANAFVTRNMPNIPQVPNFNTVGGGLDYTYKNKIGASLGMASTPFLQRKDYSAMGNLNLFRNPSSSVDFNAGFKKFDTPFMRSGWEPNFGLSFSKSF